jgi:microcystin-dependent protein
MADKKRFSEDFTHWNDAIPTAFRCMVEDPSTGEEYWVTREQFITGVTIGNMGGASAYDIYKGTTSDIPVLSETDWIDSLYGQDGVTPTIGSNGNWFIGTTDTGVKAQPENPIPTAQIFNAPMGAVLFFVGLLSSLSDSWHLANGDVVEGYGATIDMRGKVPMGYDPDSFATPTVATGLVKNYGAIGNTGGQSFVSLTIDQLPKHSFKTVIAGNNNESPLRNNIDASIVDIRDDRSDGNSDYSLDGKVGTPTLGKTNTVGDDQPHENRMEYVVGAYIQRVKPEVLSGGSGIESIVAGTNVTIDITDPKKPVINVPVVNGTNGRGIVSDEKTSTNGLVDTYTITYTDGSTSTYTVTNGANGTPGTTLTAEQLQIINTVPLICSDEKTDLTASTDVPVIRFVFQTAQSFTKIVGELNTAAVGGSLTVVAKKNGVSFLSTNLTFDSGENTTRTAAVPFVFTTPTISFTIGDYVEIFIVTVGSVTKGKGLKIYLM